jgi:hypothetical protein
MQDEAAALEVDEQVLGAPPHTAHGLSGNLSRKLRWYGPPQPRLAHDKSRDSAALDRGGNASTGRFDLWKFRHLTRL